jgi:hypothetical protein
MSENEKFDSKDFLRRSSDSRENRQEPNQTNDSVSPLPRRRFSVASFLMRPLTKIFSRIFGRIVRPFAMRFRRRLLGNIEIENNYFHSRQTQMNREILEELQKIRLLLEEKRENE